MSQVKKKVYVGLSGGVDSAVSAGLLKEQGFNVTGVFIKIWSPEWINCTAKEDRLDAMRVCATLDIPYKELDLSEEYKKQVVQNMIDEYKSGRTPNPDVLCNKEIKFGKFFDFAMREGADYVATGHYSRIETIRQIPNNKKQITNKFRLLRGRDKNKDQSYFLWAIKKEQLSKILFPIGDLEKTEVRKLAKKFGLRQATKKDSQGLCFIGHLDIKDFLSNYIKPRRGDVLNNENEIIGYHNGVEFLTIGERHGFVIDKKTPNDKPYFVTSKNIEKNTIVVSNEKESIENPALVGVAQIKDINWLKRPSEDEILECRLYYRAQLLSVKIKFNKNDITLVNVIFNKPAMPVSGQSIVFYKNEVCIGGGILV